MFIEYRNEKEIWKAVNDFCDAVLGKGYDRLELWRKGKIDKIHPDEVSYFNWDTYCEESSKRQIEAWKRENPNWEEERKHRYEEVKNQYPCLPSTYSYLPEKWACIANTKSSYIGSIKGKDSCLQPIKFLVKKILKFLFSWK